MCSLNGPPGLRNRARNRLEHAEFSGYGKHPHCFATILAMQAVGKFTKLEQALFKATATEALGVDFVAAGESPCSRDWQTEAHSIAQDSSALSDK